MNFKHPEEDLSSYVSGELSEAERNQIEEHLRSCAECAEKVAEIRHLNEVLSEADVLEPSPYFTKRVLAGVDEEKKIIAFRSRRTILWLAAAASIVFVVFLLSIQKETNPPAPISHWKPPAHSTGSPVPPVTTVPSQSTQTSAQSATTTEDPELIANLDALENWDVIQNYDNLEYLEAAVVAGNEEKSE